MQVVGTLIKQNGSVDAFAGDRDPVALGTNSGSRYDITNPGGPTDGSFIFSRITANRRWVGWVDQNSISEIIGPWQATKQVYWNIASSGLATFDVKGHAAAAVVGTAAAAFTAITNYQTMQQRNVITSAATAASMIEVKPTNGFWSRRSVGGGFHFLIKFGAVTIASTDRVFVGLKGTSAANFASVALTNVEPSSLFNIIGLGKDGADGALSLMRNDAAGTAVKTTLTNTGTWLANYTYQLEVFCIPGDTQFGWRVTRWTDTGVVSADEGVTGTLDIGAIDTIYNYHMWLSNNAVAAARALAFMRVYIEGN